jgi:hypothetical protein
MTDFESIARIEVPVPAFARGYQFLRKAGKLGYEGLVLMVGIPVDTTFRVKDLWIPKQHGVRTPEGVCVTVDAPEMHRINVELYKSNLRLIGQIHTHPTDAYHSAMDDENAIARTTGSVSIVVPDFAARPFRIAECAHYRLTPGGMWSEIDAPDAERLLVFTEH